MRILIADDEAEVAELLRLMMPAESRVDVAYDGADAFGAFRRAWEEGDPYGLIFLDIRMPYKDGRQVLQEIREFEDARDVPAGEGIRAVVTTGVADKETIMGSFFDDHCDQYIVKPIRKAKVLEVLSYLDIT